MSEDERQAIVDGEHLRILSICYWIYAAVEAFFSLFGLLYAFMGLFLTSVISHLPAQPGQSAPPEIVGVFFGLLGLGMFAFMIGLAVLKAMAAMRLQQRRSRFFCMVVGGVSCLGIPFGTALGVCTFLVLARPSVVILFDSKAHGATSGPDVSGLR